MFTYFVVAVVAVAFAGVSLAASRSFAGVRMRAYDGPVGVVERGTTPFDAFALVLLVGFSAMRAVSVGTDTIVYARVYEALPLNADWGELSQFPQEIGFTVLSVAVKSLGGDFTAFLWVTSTITVAATYWALKRVSKNFTLALALFVLLTPYLVQFNAVRQGLAVSLILLAATFLSRRRGWIVYVALVVLAASFHSSAVVAAILLVVFTRSRVTLRGLIVVGVIAVVLTVTLWASPLMLSVAEVLNPRYSTYIDWHVEAGIGLYLIIAVHVGLLLYAVLLRSGAEDMRYAAWTALGVAWLIIGVQSLVASRISSYFLVFMCVLIPNVMHDRQVKPSHTFALVAVAAVYFGFYVATFSSLVPYTW